MLSVLNDDVFWWLGNLGVAFYLGSYTALQAGLIRGNGYIYTLANLAAASLVLASLTVSFNLSSALIQGFWIVISIVGITRMLTAERRARFSDEETRFLWRAVPTMPRAMGRRLLDRGTWVTADAGHVVVAEGEPVRFLTYLSDGKGVVTSSGFEIAQIDHGFIGELNVMHEGPASATVTLTEPSRIFVLSAEALCKLCRSDGELCAILERAFRDDTNRKLVAANSALTKS